MRDHIRREAGHSTQGSWWLVPVAFATAALAAVAMTQAEAPDPTQAFILPASASEPPPQVPALPQPAEGALQLTEHLQAF